MFADVPGSPLLLAIYSEPQKMPDAKVFWKTALKKNKIKAAFLFKKIQIDFWLSLLGYFIQHISNLAYNASC